MTGTTGVRRSHRGNAGVSPARLGQGDGWGTVAAQKWNEQTKVGGLDADNAKCSSATEKKMQQHQQEKPSMKQNVHGPTLPFVVSTKQARVIEYMIVVLQLAAGAFHSHPELWLENFFLSYMWLMVLTLGTAGLTQIISRGLAEIGMAYLIQTSEKAQPTLYYKEFADTVIGYGVVVSAMLAWPVTNYKLGRETALRPSLDDCVPELPFVTRSTPEYEYAQVAVYIVKMIAGIIAADAYNYWKHRMFHHKSFWAFHKVHHSHHNPSAFGGYAVSPAFGFATFLPVYLFVFPELGLYPPIHWPVLAFYLLLNHYLHCGYVIPAVEAVLSPFGIMSSKWHNVHHEKGRVGYNYKDQTFGEMLTIWDSYMGTYPQGHYQYAGSKTL